MNMNKRIVILLIALMLSGIGYAQTVQIDPRLEKAYSAEHLQRMQKETPIVLELLNYELDYSWYIAEPEMIQKEDAIDYLYYKDPETGDRAGMVQSIEPGKVNIAEFYYERPYNSRVFYKVGKTGTVIGFYSNKEMSEMFNGMKGYSHE
jgi:hypothetical protein